MSTEKKYGWILMAGNYEYDDNRHTRSEGFGDIVKVYSNPEKAGKEAARLNTMWLRDMGSFSDYYGTYYVDDEKEMIATVRSFADRHKDILAVHAELEPPGRWEDMNDWDSYLKKLVHAIDGDLMIEFIQSLPHFMYSVHQVELED